MTAKLNLCLKVCVVLHEHDNPLKDIATLLD